jgi:hypothetical protein
VDQGTQYVALTQDVSDGGVSLLVRGLADLRVGSAARLTLQADEDLWCEGLPIRIARVRHWLGAAGRSVEVGARVEPPSEVMRRLWEQCVRRLGVSE